MINSLLQYKPQMNADKRRYMMGKSAFIGVYLRFLISRIWHHKDDFAPQRTQRAQSVIATFANFAPWYEKVKYISHLRLGCGSANINNELVRTRYELGLMS